MEDNDIKPSTIMLMAGGGVLLISTFLDWVSVSVPGLFGGGDSIGANAWESDLFGLLGIFCALIGLVIAGAVAGRQFGNLSLPDDILGFSHEQIHLVLGAMALIITLGFAFRGDVGIGLWLAVIASIVMVAGAVMDIRDDTSDATPPTQF